MFQVKYEPFLYGMVVFGKSGRSDWFFLGQDFAIQADSMEMVISRTVEC